MTKCLENLQAFLDIPSLNDFLQVYPDKRSIKLEMRQTRIDRSMTFIKDFPMGLPSCVITPWRIKKLREVVYEVIKRYHEGGPSYLSMIPGRFYRIKFRVYSIDGSLIYRRSVRFISFKWIKKRRHK